MQGQELITKTTACPYTKIEVCEVTKYETRDKWIYDSLQESSLFVGGKLMEDRIFQLMLLTKEIKMHNLLKVTLT